MKTDLTPSIRLTSFLGSDKFFWIIIGLFVVQAGWIALSSNYPMAFDEEFHLGLIRIYAEHINPFWQSVPPDSGAFGALTRDPSYLYHYLMSFPYRLISSFTSDLQTQVLLLRSINIGLFAWGLVLYRKLLLKTGAGQALVSVSLLIFTLVPVVPFLAAHINYDNLMMPLVALSLMLTLRLVNLSNTKAVSVNTLIQLAIVCLTASLVKYAYLPILIVITAYLIVWAWRQYGTFAKLWAALVRGWRQIRSKTAIALMILLIVLAGLFVERYGVNLLRYHKPVADCGEVVNYEHCSQYGPWIRDYNLNLNKGDANQSPLLFTKEWLYGMWLRSNFTLAGPEQGYQTKSPLVAPGLSSIVFGVIGVAAFDLAAKRIWRRYWQPALWLLASVSLGYVAVLWLDGYQMFLFAGKAVAINGRYLLPILPFVILLAGLAIYELTTKRHVLRIYIALVVVLGFAWGGGAMTYILRSNDTWYWPNSVLKSSNHLIQRSIGPLTPGYNSPRQFLR